MSGHRPPRSAGRVTGGMRHVYYLAFALAAIALVPWTAWLSFTLPSHHLDRRFNLAWGGFDAGLLFAMAATAVAGLRRSPWVSLATAVTGALLLTDAWFDTVTSHPGSAELVSVLLACFVELPFAALSFYLAYRTGPHSLRERAPDDVQRSGADGFVSICAPAEGRREDEERR